MTESDRQEIQSLRDEVSQLKSVVRILCNFGLTLSAMTGIPVIISFFVTRNLETNIVGSLGGLGLVYFPILIWASTKINARVKTNSPNGAIYPSTGRTPGYPDNKDAKPRKGAVNRRPPPHFRSPLQGSLFKTTHTRGSAPG